jgi:hypothetical protein
MTKTPPTITEEDVVKLRDRIDFKCPFCGRDVTIGKLPDDQVAITHVLPMCSRFEELDPSEFVHQCYLEASRSIN